MKRREHRSRAALIVGTSDSLVATLQRVFCDAEWRVETALTNISALEAAEARPFDIVITSALTSGPEDVQVLRHLRRTRPHLRMIILTNYGTRDDALAAMREHAFSFFVAPFSLDEGATAVHNAINAPSWDDGIELASANPNWIRLFARCDLETADRLVNFLFEVGEDLADSERRDVSTAFREMLLNAIEHGGHFNPKEFVEISYLRSRRAVSCRIKDPGKGFSLREVRHSAIANPPDDPLRHVHYRETKQMRPGGYGVLVARHLVDELIYTERGNEVVLIKYLDKRMPSDAARLRDS